MNGAEYEAEFRYIVGSAEFRSSRDGYTTNRLNEIYRSDPRSRSTTPHPREARIRSILKRGRGQTRYRSGSADK